jgi:hypothetical protein
MLVQPCFKAGTAVGAAETRARRDRGLASVSGASGRMLPQFPDGAYVRQSSGVSLRRQPSRTNAPLRSKSRLNSFHPNDGRWERSAMMG